MHCFRENVRDPPADWIRKGRLQHSDSRSHEDHLVIVVSMRTDLARAPLVRLPAGVHEQPCRIATHDENETHIVSGPAGF